MRNYLFGFIGLAVFFAAFAMGAEREIKLAEILPDVDVADMQNVLEDEHPLLQGEFQDTRSMATNWCQSGAWSYHVSVAAVVGNLSTDLKEDNSLAVEADLTDVNGHAEGSLRNRATFCHTISVGAPFGADGIHVAAAITFRGDPSDMANARLQIESTHIDSLHFASWLPKSIGSLLTDVTNYGLEQVWRSRLGDWISDYVTKKLKSQIPHSGLGNRLS